MYWVHVLKESQCERITPEHEILDKLCLTNTGISCCSPFCSLQDPHFWIYCLVGISSLPIIWLLARITVQEPSANYLYLGIELPYGVRVQSTDFYVIIATVLHILSYCKCKQNKKKNKTPPQRKKKISIRIAFRVSLRQFSNWLPEKKKSLVKLI